MVSYIIIIIIIIIILIIIIIINGMIRVAQANGAWSPYIWLSVLHILHRCTVCSWDMDTDSSRQMKIRSFKSFLFMMWWLSSMIIYSHFSIYSIRLKISYVILY